MKRTVMIVAALLIAGIARAGELTESDKKWSEVVTKMIEKGADKISTPDAKRAELAVELAKKCNRTASINKKEKTFEVVISRQADSATVAKSEN